jgi:hypothetical protein
MGDELNAAVRRLVEISTAVVSEFEQAFSKAEKPLLAPEEAEKVKEVTDKELLARLNQKVFDNDANLKLNLEEWSDKAPSKAKWLFESKLTRKKIVKLTSFSITGSLGAVGNLGKSGLNELGNVGSKLGSFGGKMIDTVNPFASKEAEKAAEHPPEEKKEGEPHPETHESPKKEGKEREAHHDDQKHH